MNELERVSVTNEFKDSTSQWRDLLRDKRFLWLGMPKWDGVWTRQNHFTLHLVKLGAEILYVQGSTLFQAVRDRNMPESLSGSRTTKIVAGLAVLNVPCILPGSSRSNVMAALAGWQIARAVTKRPPSARSGCTSAFGEWARPCLMR